MTVPLANRNNAMDRTFTITTAAYVFIILGCTFAFFIQRHTVFSNHISPGREQSHEPIAVQILEKGATNPKEAKLTFINDGPVTNPLRMGSEMEEQLQVLLIANLATGIYLILVHARRKPSQP